MTSPLSFHHSLHSSPVPPASDKARFRRELLTRLMEMPFPEFARTIARLLKRLGYRDVRLMGTAKGRNRHGGIDLRATAPGGLTQTLIVAQIKQYRIPVPRCYADELRGSMLRLGAQQGLIITTSSFASAACEAVAAAQHALPIRLVDGQELAELLIRTDTDPEEFQPGGTSPTEPQQPCTDAAIAPHRCSAMRGRSARMKTHWSGERSEGTTVIVSLPGVRRFRPDSDISLPMGDPRPIRW